MLKKYKGTIILTSVITLLPIIAGLILWDSLPAEIATHFGTNNMPDRYSSKAFAVFGLPLVLLGIHLLSIVATNLDPKNKNSSPKVFGIVMWLVPLLSLVLMSVTYSYALGKAVRIGFIITMFLGIVFILLGNYMPKTKQNYTVGMKLPWTLDDKDNWAKTHRLTGRLMVLGGATICATATFENPWIFFPTVILMAVIPMIYSYKLYKDKGKEEK